MNIAFYLDRVKKTDLINWSRNPKDCPNTEASIWMYLTWSGNRYRYNTGKKILICDWEEVKIIAKNGNESIIPVQRVKARVTGSGEINTFLDALQLKVSQFANKCELENKIPQKASILQLLTAREEQYDFESLFMRFIADSENGIRRTKDGKIFSAGTIKNYKSCLSSCLEFQKKTRYALIWENINDRFYNALTNYYWDHKSYFDNNTGKYIKILKTFLKWCNDEGFTDTKLYSSKWKVWSEEIDIIVFYPDELRILYNMQLSGQLEEDRDLYLAGCMTCLRVSNLLNIKPVDLVGDFLKVVSVKTGKPMFIPVNPILKGIFAKYMNRYGTLLPPRIEQQFNKGLKEMAAMMGEKISDMDLPPEFIGNEWHKPFTRIRFRRGQPVEEIHQLPELITTHTMRRTGITNLLMAGLSEIEVKEISGHSASSSEFSKYVRIAKRFIERKSNQAWSDIIGTLRVV